MVQERISLEYLLIVLISLFSSFQPPPLIDDFGFRGLMYAVFLGLLIVLIIVIIFFALRFFERMGFKILFLRPNRNLMAISISTRLNPFQRSSSQY